ncbi:MAG: ParB N-terminal domain-containing protein [Armatimonadetes bacterium]|nr:ParB N-terminal domain-containing protein [Armatimonadota bacterium]
METIEIPLEKITIDENIQPRLAGLSDTHIRELEACPGWPPIVVVQKDGGWLLIDGHHRVAAGQNLGLEKIEAQQIEEPADHDLRGLAFGLNSRHGQPLSLSDRRAEAERMLRRDPTVSNMEISRRTALSPSTVEAIREALEQKETIEPVAVRKTASGFTYTPNRKLGELPAVGLLDQVEGFAGKLISPKVRADQRAIAHYYRRLSVALADMENLPDNDGEPRFDADACRAVFGAGKSTELGRELGERAQYLLDVSHLLGFHDE